MHTGHQRNGWNYARVTHVVGSTTNTCNYAEWVNDSDSNALAQAGSVLDSLSMTGTKNLSGVNTALSLFIHILYAIYESLFFVVILFVLISG